MSFDIYSDIAKRTGGDIYLGVVGPVRTGKSTFIKRFMETLVLDKITDESKRKRAVDELPQSADGKTIMTTEPKFVPNEAVRLNLDNTVANIRLIDCVGYLVEDALGHIEGDKPRLVHTPWTEEELPFQVAAEIGTEKVIREHSTIGVVVTTDGTITDIARPNYVNAEERVINELKTLDKPFVIVLNTKTPEAATTVTLADNLTERYSVPVIPMNVATAGGDDFGKLLLKILMEFPLNLINVKLPKWMRALGKTHKLVQYILGTLVDDSNKYSKMSDYTKLSSLFEDSEYLSPEPDIEVESATGIINLNYKAKDGLFYKVLAESCDADIDDDYKLMSYVIRASKAQHDYDKLKSAMQSVEENGYGIVIPTIEEMELEEPELIKKGTQFGIKLRASAPSLHIVKVDVNAEICPAIGSEQQSEELLNSLTEEYATDKSRIWDTNIFGKPLSSMVCDDIGGKIANMPQDAQRKLKKTMTRIVNENKGGVLCILL